jgi:hypothetical protein
MTLDDVRRGVSRGALYFATPCPRKANHLVVAGVLKRLPNRGCVARYELTSKGARCLAQMNVLDVQYAFD